MALLFPNLMQINKYYVLVSVYDNHIDTFYSIINLPLGVVNAMVDHDRIPLVREAMIRCGLAHNTNGCWEITELLQHLQDNTELSDGICWKMRFN